MCGDGCARCGSTAPITRASGRVAGTIAGRRETSRRGGWPPSYARKRRTSEGAMSCGATGMITTDEGDAMDRKGTMRAGLLAVALTAGAIGAVIVGPTVAAHLRVGLRTAEL